MALTLPSKIDVHHHYLPPAYIQALADNGGDPSGWKTPEWSPAGSQSLLNDTGASHAILSITAPGVLIAPDAQASAALARDCNDYASQLSNDQPKSFSFFANLPSLTDTAATLAEIDRALDLPGCRGFTIFTCYAGHYLGDAVFQPIWAELNRRKAVVFVHPTHGPHVDLAHSTLPLPMIDYPQETTRAAVSLIVTGTKRRFPDVKIILSHAGGTLPYLADRLATMYPYVWPESGSTHASLVADAKSFYFDLALSTAHHVLDLVVPWAGAERVMWGSDTPYAPRPGVVDFATKLDEWETTEEIREMVYRGNALQMFPGIGEQA